MSSTRAVERVSRCLERLPLVTYTLLFDPAGPPLYVSPQLEPLFGYAPADCMADDGFWTSRIAVDDRPRVLAALERLRDTREQMSVEYRVTTSDDRVVWVRDVAVVTLEDDGELYIHGYLSDITNEKMLECELAAERAAAEKQYRSLIEQLPLVTYVNELQPSYRSVYVSPQIEELFGYHVVEWMADVTLWDRVVHPADVPIVRRAEAEARNRRQPFELEYRVVRSDGSIGWILDCMETSYDADGVAQSERGFLIDVTARRQSEQMFRAVFDNAFEAVLLIDDEARVVDSNPAACALFGLSRDDLAGRSIGEFAEPGADVDDLWRGLFARGEATGARVLVRGDDSRRHIEYSAKAHVLPGRHLVVLRDVTERRALERELWHAHRLESVGRLAGGVAQDFNNMLTAIRGYAQLLVARAAPGTPEHHDATQIDRAAGRAADLTAQLLALGQRQTFESQDVDLNRLVMDLGEAARRAYGDKVDVTFDLDPDACSVRVDPAQIQKLLLNLIANAAEATCPQGSIIVRTANAPSAPFVDLEDGRYAVVSVEDFGTGIDRGAIEHLFEPFFTTKEVGVGLGLGLAASYGIAKQSGGTIVVDSEPGRGSTFSVYLPAAAETRDLKG